MRSLRKGARLPAMGESGYGQGIALHELSPCCMSQIIFFLHGWKKVSWPMRQGFSVEDNIQILRALLSMIGLNYNFQVYSQTKP